MNKKFSTLAVAAMLASAFTAYAGPGDVVTQLAEGNNGKQYQLRALVNESGWTDKGYLVLDEKDGALKLVEDPNNYNNESVLGKSLWCVDVTLENQGKNPIFDFINKGEGSVLDVTVGGWNTSGSGWTSETVGSVTYKQASAEARVGGEISGWEFTPGLGSTTQPMFQTTGDADALASNPANGKLYGLSSYVNSTHVATLVWDDDDNTIKVAVVAADKLADIADKQIMFFLQEAYPVDLTAKQFNTILNTQKETESVKMTFVKDYNNTEVVNPFSTNELNAIDAIIDTNDPKCTSATCKLAGKHNFVYLYKTEADATKNYLRVDTAYANGFGTKFLTFAFGSEFRTSTANNTKSKELEKEAIIPGQYKFRLNYCPTDDSLSIQVKSALYKLKDDGKPWSDVKNYGSEDADYRRCGDVWGGGAGAVWCGDTWKDHPPLHRDKIRDSGGRPH